MSASAPPSALDLAALDLTELAARSGPHRASEMAGGLVASEILRIAAEIRGLVRGGTPVCNLTVGDFDPKQFPIPAAPPHRHHEGPGERRDELSALRRRASNSARPCSATTNANSA